MGGKSGRVKGELEIIIISLFNVDAKKKVKNYNKKRNYSLYKKIRIYKMATPG